MAEVVTPEMTGGTRMTMTELALSISIPLGLNDHI